MSPQMLGTQFKHQNSIDLTLGTPLDLKFEKLHIRNTQTWVASREAFVLRCELDA